MPLINNVLPVFLLIALGQVLLRLQMLTPEFLRVSDRLVYYIFFPALLFWKIGTADISVGLPWNLVGAALMTITLAWISSLAFCRAAATSRAQAGSFSQLCFRFNTYIGLAVVLNALGEEGVTSFGLLISVAIPYINLLAVSTLVWFSSANYSGGDKAWLVLRGVVANPLILACAAGITYSRLGPEPPVVLANTFRLLSVVTLPLALISIGAGLRFASLRGHMHLSLASSVIKLLVMPLMGWGLLRLWGVSGLDFSVGIIFCALPTATSSYILAALLKGDTQMTAAAIVVSTLLSFFTLSWAMLALGQ